MSLTWRPHTTALLVGGVVLIVIASAIAFMATQFQPRTEIRLGSGVFQVKVAQDEVTRTQGLSGVSSLSPNEGLLMVFETEDKYGIWMKDMKIAIDIVWLDTSKKVVHIVQNAQPELGESRTFTPKKPAKYVLELPAGATSQYSIQPGDQANFTVGGQ